MAPGHQHLFQRPGGGAHTPSYPPTPPPAQTSGSLLIVLAVLPLNGRGILPLGLWAAHVPGRDSLERACGWQPEPEVQEAGEGDVASHGGLGGRSHVLPCGPDLARPDLPEGPLGLTSELRKTVSPLYFVLGEARSGTWLAMAACVPGQWYTTSLFAETKSPACRSLGTGTYGAAGQRGDKTQAHPKAAGGFKQPGLCQPWRVESCRGVCGVVYSSSPRECGRLFLHHRKLMKIKRTLKFTLCVLAGPIHTLTHPLGGAWGHTLENCRRNQVHSYYSDV